MYYLVGEFASQRATYNSQQSTCKCTPSSPPKLHLDFGSFSSKFEFARRRPIAQRSHLTLARWRTQCMQIPWSMNVRSCIWKTFASIASASERLRTHHRIPSPHNWHIVCLRACSRSDLERVLCGVEHGDRMVRIQLMKSARWWSTLITFFWCEQHEPSRKP